MKTGLFDLSGRVAVVTGGNGGIGLGMAGGLAEVGAAIAIVGRNEAKSAAAVTEFQQRGAKAISVTADVTDKSAVAAVVERVSGSLAGSTFSSTTPASISVNRRRRSHSRNGTVSSGPTSPARSCARRRSIRP